MNKPTTILLAFFLSATALGAHAKAEKIIWYQVEVILFAQEEPSHHLTESWHNTPAIRWPDQMVVLKPFIEDTLPEPDDEIYHEPFQQTTGRAINERQPTDLASEPFVLLPSDRLQLTRFASRIKASSTLRLLEHFGWRQPINNGAQAQPVFIQAGDRYGINSELEGTLSVRKKRYLHFATQLVFSRFSNAVINRRLDWSIFGESPLLEGVQLNINSWNPDQDDHLFNSNGAENYSRSLTVMLDSSERINAGTMTYFDHPLFGLAIRVVAFDPVMEMKPFKLEKLPQTVTSLTEVPTIEPLPEPAQNSGPLQPSNPSPIEVE